MGSQQEPTPDNSTLFQAFEWNVPADKKHFQRLLRELPKLKAIGIDKVWLPPACKASSDQGNGYDIYDLYDVGEFDQKGGVATKWGTKEELLKLVDKADEIGVKLILDTVLNHKAGADGTEKFEAVEVDNQDRNKPISDPYEIEGWTRFDFPGRGDKYSSQKYHWYHFSGIDYNQSNEKKAVYLMCGEGKRWSKTVSREQGNGDYLMFADLDYKHPEVSQDVKNWGVWVMKELRLGGFRLDAIQHFSQTFTSHWIDYLKDNLKTDFFVVGEYWVSDSQELVDYLQGFADNKHHVMLFDAPLLYNFSSGSKSEAADLSKILDGSLVQARPMDAVTVVMNHDTQPGQTVATPIEGFFKPLAYAIILLRRDGYPCPFYGDLYGLLGNEGTGAPQEEPSCGGKLADIILARTLYAYGDQDEYMDEPNCIGWVRKGTWDKPAGCAVIMSNTGPGQKRMAVGQEHKGEVWTDVLGWQPDEVTIDDEGFGLFPCPGTSVAIWVNKDAEGRDKFPVNFDSDIYKE